MKYYIYISETKLDMLYNQIPVNLREKIASELKIDLKVISTTLSEKPSEKNTLAKLKFVTDYIDKHEEVGTIENSASFFRGKMEMRWSPLYSRNQNAVLFAGENDITHNDKDKSVVVLGGSLKHIIGEKEIPSPENAPGTSSFSGLPSIYFWLRDVDWQASQINFVDNEIALSVIVGAAWEVEGPTQTVEFLAKRLLEGEAFNRKVLIGSPIYVALADSKSADNQKAPDKIKSLNKRWWQFWK
jgi:hypothetical protein